MSDDFYEGMMRADDAEALTRSMEDRHVATARAAAEQATEDAKRQAQRYRKAHLTRVLETVRARATYGSRYATVVCSGQGPKLDFLVEDLSHLGYSVSVANRGAGDKDNVEVYIAWGKEEGGTADDAKRQP